ncbi:MAG: RsmB/NOP family class I SAM-dependent RNA methyltransferase [Desulfovibrio sp.]|nr:RsmB/NOP family class I SAM-dependent RNA methyltransferase [Desulfovibrio sp.]
MQDISLRSFRIHSSEQDIPKVCALLEEEGYRFQKEPFSPFCFRLLTEPNALGSSLAALFGYIYIQDRSSMLPPLALSPDLQNNVLDMCSSPGSKTSFLATLMQGQGCILANEPNNTRLATLRANLERLDTINCLTCHYEGQKLPLTMSWDAILLDPPCSGWGTSKKNPRVLQLWQGEKVDRLVSLQRQLLTKAYSLLKPGGRLLYSTCTTNRQENEEQVCYAEEYLGFRRQTITPFPGFVFDEAKDGAGTLRVNEEESNAQGFFLALLTKDASKHESFSNDEVRMEEEKTERVFPSVNLDTYSNIYTGNLPQGSSINVNEAVYFLPQGAKDCLSPSFRYKGSELGELNAGTFHPRPRRRILAFSQPREGIDLCIDSTKTIRALLSGQTMKTQLPGKEALLFWRDLPLGWIRLKQGRVIASFR